MLKAEYDVVWWGRHNEAQASAAAQQQAADALRTAAAAREAALRAEEAKRAMEAAKAAEAKKRDEDRKARRRERREARRAEEERQKKAAEENREENERRAAIEAAKAAEEKKKKEEELARKKAEAAVEAAKAAEKKKKKEEELARKKAEAAHAAAARAAELERQRKKEARRVVFRHVPTWAVPWDVTTTLHWLKPGRILDVGAGEGTAWVEFRTAEEAEALHRFVTETDQFVIRDKTIKTASIYPGRVKPPEGPDLITRSLFITARTEFLDGEAKMYPVVIKKLATKGFTTSPVGFEEQTLPTGRYIIVHYASVVVAQSAKAALGKHFPELAVSYTLDHCERPVSRAQDGAEAGSESSKKESESWFGPGYFMNMAMAVVLAVVIDRNRDKSSAKDGQQKREDQ